MATARPPARKGAPAAGRSRGWRPSSPPRPLPGPSLSTRASGGEPRVLFSNRHGKSFWQKSRYRPALLAWPLLFKAGRFVWVFFPGYTVIAFGNLPRNCSALSVLPPWRDPGVKHQVPASSARPAGSKSRRLLVLFPELRWTSRALAPGSSWKQNNVDFTSLFAGLCCCLTGTEVQLFDSRDFLTWDPFSSLQSVTHPPLLVLVRETRSDISICSNNPFASIQESFFSRYDHILMYSFFQGLRFNERCLKKPTALYSLQVPLKVILDLEFLSILPVLSIHYILLFQYTSLQDVSYY